MAIAPGSYTTGDLLKKASFDVNQAAADYLDGKPDFRRVTVGGLGFDSLDDRITVPATANTVEVTLDGTIVQTLEVVLKAEKDKAERAYAFEVAADANDE